jgi:indolepyruvate ferredoxin oxidoreductase
VTSEPALDDKYHLEEGRIFLTGIQSLVRVLLDQQRAERRAGRRTATFVSGYPGSPLGGLDRELARQDRLLRELDIVHTPA